MQRPNLLSGAECRELCWLQQSCRRQGYMEALSVVTFRELLSEPALLIPLVAARERVLEQVEEAFGEVLHIEYTGLLCWEAGAVIAPHYDANRPYLAQRHFSALVYLNSQGEQFQGGSFVFETAAAGMRVVRPRPGLLLAFSSGPENVHWVAPITCGERYVLTLWFTRHASHNEEAALLPSIGPRRQAPDLSLRDKAVAAALLARHQLVVRAATAPGNQTAVVGAAGTAVANAQGAAAQASTAAALPDSPSDTAVSVAPFPRPAGLRVQARSGRGLNKRALRSSRWQQRAGHRVVQPARLTIGWRATRYGSLHVLLQIAAFARCRSGELLGNVLTGEASVDELTVWTDWRRYKARLEAAYLKSLSTWLEVGFLQHCSDYCTEPSWASPLGEDAG